MGIRATSSTSPLRASGAVYVFSGYRSGGPLSNEKLRPHIAVRFTDSRLELDALVRLDGLSVVHPLASLRIGLSAVIETSDGFSYWALRHRADKPDFRDADGFALLLEPSGPPSGRSTALKFGFEC